MAMSENGRKVLGFLKDNAGKDLTMNDVAEALEIKGASVTGSFNALVKKGLGSREVAEIKLEDGTHKQVKFLRLNEEGLAYDPDAVVEAK